MTDPSNLCRILDLVRCNSSGACGYYSWDITTAKFGREMQPMAPPGHEGVGYVANLGSGVTRFKKGDQVTGGGFATI